MIENVLKKFKEDKENKYLKNKYLERSDSTEKETKITRK